MREGLKGGEPRAGRRSGLFDRRIGLVRQVAATLGFVWLRAPEERALRQRAPHRPHKRQARDASRQPSVNQLSLTIRFVGRCDRGNPCVGSRRAGPGGGSPVEVEVAGSSLWAWRSTRLTR